MSDLILIYITCGSVEEAREIGRHLLERRVCGCVNIFPEMQPMYWWPPKANIIEEQPEVVLIVKTLEKYFPKVETEVRKFHSSETPCLIAMPVIAVNDDYYQWIKGELMEEIDA